MLSGRVQHSHLLGVKPSLLCWALWARSATKQRYTRTCARRAACCIWCALQQILVSLWLPENHRIWGILLGSWTHWWIAFPPQVHVSLRRDCMSLVWQLCLRKLQKAHWLSWDPGCLCCNWVGIHRWSPLGFSVSLGCGGRWVALNHLLFWQTSSCMRKRENDY